MPEGLKFDEGKLDWHAMPMTVLEPLVEVFEAGIAKGYGRHNCLLDFTEPDRRFFSASMRHLVDSQLDPLAKDEETGCFHLAQVAFNALLRLHHCRKKPLLSASDIEGAVARYQTREGITPGCAAVKESFTTDEVGK